MKKIYVLSIIAVMQVFNLSLSAYNHSVEGCIGNFLALFWFYMYLYAGFETYKIKGVNKVLNLLNKSLIDFMQKETEEENVEPANSAENETND